ncbi:MAG: threonylcarbamoyl-AMP synthase [Anaerolineae bacterium]|nr:threonylcarbamoyl-AMP synthase [Anaerolineae bacterium]
MTEWLSIDDPQAGEKAAQVIRAGGLIILPTDTVYGVAADLWQPEAVAALYAAKKRPPDRAIPVLLAAFEDIPIVSGDVPPLARHLAEAFWPGPLTLAVSKRAELPEIVTAYPTVGVRIPDHNRAREVIHACGGALAVTSANLSGQPSPITAQEAADSLGESVDLVLDGGPCPGGIPSTVVDISGGELVIVRAGPLSESILRRVIGR